MPDPIKARVENGGARPQAGRGLPRAARPAKPAGRHTARCAEDRRSTESPEAGGKQLPAGVLALALMSPLVALGLPAGAQDKPEVKAEDKPTAGGNPDEKAAESNRQIAAIEFKGLKTLSEETVLYYLGIEPGQALDEEKLNRNIRQLWDRGLIDDIKVDEVPADVLGKTVRVVITVQERPPLRSIDYEGIKRLSKTDIQDKIASQRIRVHEGEPLSLGELQRIKTLIEDLYREKGYRFAQARYSVKDLGNNEKRVVFSVDEGDRVRIGGIQFAGNRVFGDHRLRWVMKKTKKTEIVSRIMKSDIYDPAKLQEDLDKVRDLYRRDGYKNVVIGDPKIEVRAAKPQAAAVKDQKRRMYITIPLDEGDRWKFGGVSIDGNKVYPDSILLKTFEHRGDSWLRSKVVDDGVKAIEDLYHNTGYIYAHVEPELIEKPDHVADLVVHVDESEQFKVGRIEFAGNDRTMDKVLRREVRLIEGGLVNIAAVRSSVFKVNQLGYFKLDEEDPVDIQTDSENKQVSLVFKGKETNRTDLQFGGGWSALDGLFGQFAINTKNFLGRGEQLGASIQAGARRNLYDLSYFIPWFLDKPQSLGIQAYDSRTNFLALLSSGFNTNAKGIVFTYGRNYRLFQSASISYQLSKRDDQTFLGNLVANTYHIDVSSIRPAYAFDSRDDPFQPIRGKRAAFSIEYAGGPLGGSERFLRPEAQVSWFQPVNSNPTNMVFALNVNAGLLHHLGNQPLSPLEYYFLGGEDSVRGFRFRSITVRDAHNQPLLDPTGVAIGGDKKIQINAEYHFVLGGPFRILAFTDAGNVYGPGQSFDLARLRYSAGIEVRILVPMFGAPLRFIYAKSLKPLPQDSFDSFQFSIGTSF